MGVGGWGRKVWVGGWVGEPRPTWTHLPAAVTMRRRHQSGTWGVVSGTPSLERRRREREREREKERERGRFIRVR